MINILIGQETCGFSILKDSMESAEALTMDKSLVKPDHNLVFDSKS